MIELTEQEAALVADLMKIANYPLAQVEVAAGLKAKLVAELNKQLPPAKSDCLHEQTMSEQKMIGA